MQSSALASWWGYAEGNPAVVGTVVGIVVLAALIYVGQRVWRARG